MTWVKLDDGFTDHPKVVGLSDRAFRVHVRALCYCARFSQGVGEIPASALPSLRATKAIVSELVGARLWDEDDAGALTIHDFSEYHPGRVDREAKSAAGRIGGQRSGEARRGKREAETKQSASKNEARASQNDEAERSSRVDARPYPDPIPSRPDPSLREASLPIPIPAEVVVNGTPLRRAFDAAAAVAGKELSRVQYDLVSSWCEESNPEWVRQACEVAVSNNAASLSYVRRVLDGWGTSGPPERSKPSGNRNRNAAPDDGLTARLEARTARQLGIELVPDVRSAGR